MIPFHTLTAFLPPGALTVAKAALDNGRSAPGGRPQRDNGETILAQLRQIKADWDGHPDVAEQIYQIVKTTVKY